MALALSGGEAIVVYRKIPGNKQIIPGFQNYDGDHNFLKAPKNPLNDTKKKPARMSWPNMSKTFYSSVSFNREDHHYIHRELRIPNAL